MNNKKELSPLRQKDIRTGAKQERERIIALLEAQGWSGLDPRCTVNVVIALIKGENE